MHISVSWEAPYHDPPSSADIMETWLQLQTSIALITWDVELELCFLHHSLLAHQRKKQRNCWNHSYREGERRQPAFNPSSMCQWQMRDSTNAFCCGSPSLYIYFLVYVFWRRKNVSRFYIPSTLWAFHVKLFFTNFHIQIKKEGSNKI